MSKPVLIKPELQEDDDENKDADKTEPRLPDGGDGEEVDADFYLSDDKPICTWSDDPEEHRRVFVFDRMNDSGVDGKILVQNMELINQWLKSGDAPKHKENQRQIKLASKE